MNRYVIYTAIVGKYDTILQPAVVDDRFDYVIFSNDVKDDHVGIWQVRHIPFTHTDPTRIARYVKTHPEELLIDYQYSIWIDAAVQIISYDFYNRAISIIQAGGLVSANAHPFRNCIYDEMFVVMQHSLESEKIALKWGKFLRKAKYPRNNGLSETNILLRQHHDASVAAFDDLWWQCISKYSRRDQLSFNYVAWKLQMEVPVFYNDLRKSPDIEYHYHDKATNRQISESNSRLMQHCQKWPTNNFRNVRKLYYFSYLFPSPSLVINIMYYVRNVFLKITKGDLKYSLDTSSDACQQ